MSGQINEMPVSNSSDIYSLKEDNSEANGEKQVHHPSRTWPARDKMARWMLVVLSVIAFALWGRASETPLNTIDQRVNQILSKSPLIGRKNPMVL